MKRKCKDLFLLHQISNTDQTHIPPFLSTVRCDWPRAAGRIKHTEMQWWSPYQDGTPCEHWNFSSHSTGMCLSLFESIIYFIFDDSYHVVMTGLSDGGSVVSSVYMYICAFSCWSLSHTHTHVILFLYKRLFNVYPRATPFIVFFVFI